MEGVACAKCTLAAALRDPVLAALLRDLEQQDHQQQWKQEQQRAEERERPFDCLQHAQPQEVHTGSGAAGTAAGAAGAAAAAALLRQAAALVALPSLVPLPDLGELDALLASLSDLRQSAAQQHQQPPSVAHGGTASGPSSPELVAAAAAAGGAATPPERLPSLPPLCVVRRRALRGSHVALLPRVLVLQLLRSVWDPRVGAPVKDGRHVAFPTRLGRDDLALLRGQRQRHQSEQRHHGKQQQAGEATTDLVQHEGDGGKEGEGEGANDDGLPYEADCEDERYAPYTLTAVVVHYGGASSGHYLMYRRVPAAVRVAATLGSGGGVAAGGGGQVYKEAVAVGPACGGAAVGSGTGSNGALVGADGGKRDGAGSQGPCVWLRVSDSSVGVVQEGEVLRQVAALLVYERA